jgi:hypothetical protein
LRLERTLRPFEAIVSTPKFAYLSARAYASGAGRNSIKETVVEEQNRQLRDWERRALECLQFAAIKGYLASDARKKQLVSEPDFAALSKHQDFLKLLASLAPPHQDQSLLDKGRSER